MVCIPRVSSRALRLGADAVDAPGRQRPDARRNVRRRQDRQAIGLLQVGAELRQELVRRDADGAAQPRGGPHRGLDGLAQGAHAGVRVGHRRVTRARNIGEVEVDLVDAAVFDRGREPGDGHLEQARELAVFVEVGGQQDRVGRQRRRLHQPHAGVHAQRPRLVGGGGDHAAAGVVAAAARSVGYRRPPAPAAWLDRPPTTTGRPRSSG